MDKRDVKTQYQEKEEVIEERLNEFEKLRTSSDERKFKELVFVILSSQTESQKAWDAAQKISHADTDKQITKHVLEKSGVSYPENKAEYILKNKSQLSQPTLTDPDKNIKINSRINEDNLNKTRRWLTENINGISWKGASHFLRNIGYGNGFAIISGHISSQMYELGLTETPKPPQNHAEYVKTEKKLQEFSKDIKIDIKALDMVLWSMKTGEVFK